MTTNDLQFLTGPSVADIDGQPGEEMVEGSASQDFEAYNGAGTPVSGWPKLSTDWTVANPLIGTFGTRDTDPGTHKVVLMMTRSGYLSAYDTERRTLHAGLLAPLPPRQRQLRRLRARRCRYPACR